MIDRALLRYPEQMAARLSALEKKVNELEREVKKLKKEA